MNKGEGRGFDNFCLNIYRKLLTAVAVANIINAGKILTGNRIKLGMQDYKKGRTLQLELWDIFMANLIRRAVHQIIMYRVCEL